MYYLAEYQGQEKNVLECEFNNDILFKKYEINNNIIKVNKNQLVCLIEKGRILDYKDTQGEYIVENNKLPEKYDKPWNSFIIRDAETQSLCAVFFNKSIITNNKYIINDPIKYVNWKNGEEKEIYIKINGTYNFKIQDSAKFLSKAIGLSSIYVKQELIERIRGFVLNSIQIGINELSKEYKLDIDTLYSKSKELEIKLKQNEYDVKLLEYGIKLTYFDITNFEITKKKKKFLKKS